MMDTEDAPRTPPPAAPPQPLGDWFRELGVPEPAAPWPDFSRWAVEPEPTYRWVREASATS